MRWANASGAISMPLSSHNCLRMAEQNTGAEKMESLASVSFNALVEMFLGSPLPQRLTANIAFSELSSEARAFILRMLVLMKRASFPATIYSFHRRSADRAAQFNHGKIIGDVESA
jgi:hypothetical protein